MNKRKKTFIALYEAHYDELHAFCARRVGPQHASDVTADVFTVAWKRIGDLDIEMPRAWLFGVARGVIRNRWRGNRRRYRLKEKILNQPAPPVESADMIAERRETDIEVLKALHRLSKSDQQLLRLSAWDDLTGPEIAEVLDVSLQAVHKRLSRAKARLARQLESADGALAAKEQMT